MPCRQALDRPASKPSTLLLRKAHRIALYRHGQFSRFVPYKRALNYLSKGYIIRDDQSIEYKAVVSPSSIKVFHDPPPNANFTWMPKPSNNYIVMQAKWGRSA
jgi:hypothetical protein